MVLAAFWSVVQYRAMQLMPWLLMLRSPRCPSDGILLDYLSDWVMISLYKSIRRKHFFITFTILGTLLLTGATVTSTGLLTVQTMRFDREASMRVPWGFNGSDYDPDTVDSRAYATQMAVELFDGSPPLGLQENHAFSPFYAESGRAGDTFMSKNLSQATVDVFTMELDCEDTPISTPQRDVIATHPRDKDCWHNYGAANFDSDPRAIYEDPEYRLYMKLLGCKRQELHSSSQPIREIDWRIWVVLSHLEPNATVVDTGRWTLAYGPEGPYYNKSTAFVSWRFLAKVCTPRYTIRKALTSISYTNDSSPAVGTIDFDEQGEADTIPGVSAHDILYGVWHSLSVSTKSSQTPVALLLSADENGKAQYWGTDRLQRELKQKVSAMGAQVARQYMLKPADIVTRGRANSLVKRLVVRELAFGLVTTILGLLVAIASGLIIVYLPAAACPRDPGSIAGLATILSRSPEIMEHLTDMGSKPISAITALISDQKHGVSATREGDFVITIHRVSSANRRRSTGNDQIEWWRPLSVRIPVRSLTFGIPLALICTLESLSQHSKRSGGIAPIEDEISPVRYTWTYIPALVMLAVRILFHDLESCARIFQPYNCLQRAHAVPRMSILEDYKGKLSLVVLLNAARKRHWALAAAAMGVLVSFALPIAVAGLYTTDTVMQPIEVNLTRLDRWRFKDSNHVPYTDVRAKDNLLGGLLLYLDDVTEPQWTYQNLAIPKVVLSDLSMDPGYFDARLPAVRGSYACQHIPPDQITWEIKGPNKYIKDADPSSRMIYPTYTTQKVCTGFDQPSIVPFNVELPESGGYLVGRYNTEIDDCPQYMEMFGKANGTREEDIEDFFVLGCSQRLEQVDVDLRLSLPSYNLDLSKTPTIVANSSKMLVERWLNQSSIFEPVLPNTTDALLDFSMGNNEDTNLSMLDRTLRASIYGINGTKNPDDYLDPTRYIERKNWVIGIVTAQTLNSHARVELNTSEQHVIGTANLFRPRLYVVQSRVSTSILEGALAAMVLCGAAAITLMKTRHVLPKNPTTIAAVASLLAGSEMMKENVIPRGSEWCDDKELKRRRVFEDLTFSMKWWPGQKEPAAADDDDEGPETRSNGAENPASRASSRSRSNDESTLRESSHSNAGSTLRGSSVSSEHRSIGEDHLPNEAVQEEELSLIEVPSNEALAGDALDQDQNPTSGQERPRDRFGIDVDQLAVSV
ncbi:DUF3433 domain-containing protein [Aspergillus affinis]|uniref:DUF3433 domain-containing protein n=1 Tax=Aspergillus affinis TaxID=1070780 RepID=UPI0022FE740E|nr:uncharacterized protein KD926_001483 [Aspergillus affinis]KAI9044253.1 hypothetical protein KD926_001483 [Aspergillus affinis]